MARLSTCCLIGALARDSLAAGGQPPATGATDTAQQCSFVPFVEGLLEHWGSGQGVEGRSALGASCAAVDESTALPIEIRTACAPDISCDLTALISGDDGRNKNLLEDCAAVARGMRHGCEGHPPSDGLDFAAGSRGNL